MTGEHADQEMSQVSNVGEHPGAGEYIRRPRTDHLASSSDASGLVLAQSRSMGRVREICEIDRQDQRLADFEIGLLVVGERYYKASEQWENFRA